MKTDDPKVVKAIAAAAGISPIGLGVEVDGDFLLVNHQESQTWSPEIRAAVKAAGEKATGLKVSIM